MSLRIALSLFLLSPLLCHAPAGNALDIPIQGPGSHPALHLFQKGPGLSLQKIQIPRRMLPREVKNLDISSLMLVYVD